MICCGENNLEMAEFLIDSKAQVNIQSTNGTTALKIVIKKRTFP
jgi:ankyrin repeat protein